MEIRRWDVEIEGLGGGDGRMGGGDRKMGGRG